MPDDKSNNLPACPKCGAQMRLRNGRNGQFFGCSTYPECRGTADCPPDHPALVKAAGTSNDVAEAAFWQEAFFEERRWWLRQQPAATPGYSPERLHEIATRECMCVACGQPLPKATKQGSKER